MSKFIIFTLSLAAFIGTGVLWIKFGGLVFIEMALAKVSLCF